MQARATRLARVSGGVRVTKGRSWSATVRLAVVLLRR
jgi:hypothetical protein